MSADTIVPSAGNPQSLNRYSYVVGNPLKYIDPSGHRHCVDVDENGRCIAWENPRTGEIEWNVARGINVFFAAVTIFGCVAAPSQVPPAGAPVKRGYTGNYFSPQQVGMAPIAGDAQMVHLPPPPEVPLLASGQAASPPALPHIKPAGLLPGTGVGPWDGTPVSFELDEDVVMYRVWGDNTKRVGTWLLPYRPPDAATARRYLALPPGNTAEYVSEVLVPAGTRVEIGWARRNFGQPGGALQVQLVDYIPESNFGPGQPLP